MLALLLAVVALCVALIVTGATMAPPDDAPITTATQTLGIALLVAGIVAVCVAPVLLLMGFFTIQPNQARVLILFGDYKGTVRDEGFHWANPFYSRNAGSTVDVATGKPIAKSTKVSLCARTYNGEHLKVNGQVRQPHRDRRRHRVARREHGESAVRRGRLQHLRAYAKRDGAASCGHHVRL